MTLKSIKKNKQKATTMKVTQNYIQLKQQNKLKTQKIQIGRKNEEQRKNYKIQKHKEHLKNNQDYLL